MKILYYSCLVSQHLLQEIFSQSKNQNTPSQSVQKFHRLLVEGLISTGFDLKCISSIPFSNNNIDLRQYHFKNDTGFYYTSIFNKYSFVRHIINFISSFFYTLKNSDSNCIGVFDYLNFSVSLGGYIACKLKRIKTVIVVTDFPDLMVASKSSKLIVKLKYKWINSFDAYILLSEYMNEIVNKKNKQYLVVEGIVDSNFEAKNYKKDNVILYAGGLYKKYGVNKLIDAFLKTDSNIELHLYGSGDSVKYIEEVIKKTSRVKYFGVVENKIIVDKIQRCLILVNPRPSDLKLSKYSFPSKNLEYMLSGTPLITTKLPSIPVDHYPYLYFFEDESESGFVNAFNSLLKRNHEDLIIKGKAAQQYVKLYKSNLMQGKRIGDFLISIR